MSDLNDMLERPGDEVVKPKRAKKSLDETAPIPTDGDLAIAALQAENDELKARMAKFEKMLEAMGTGGEVDAPPKRDELDKSRPYAKTRTMGGGVTFAQGGRRFDARGRLMAEE